MRNLGNVVFAGSPLTYEQKQCAGEWTAPLKFKAKLGNISSEILFESIGEFSFLEF